MAYFAVYNTTGKLLRMLSQPEMPEHLLEGEAAEEVSETVFNAAGLSPMHRVAPGQYTVPTPSVQERVQVVADEIRYKRTRLLAESDWTQVPDSPLSVPVKEAWAAYRARLRDMPSLYHSAVTMAQVEWPQPPQ